MITGNTSATSPKNQYINDLSNRYGLSGGTVYDKKSNTGFSNPQDFFKSSGVNSFDGLKFDTSYNPNQQNTQVNTGVAATPVKADPYQTYLKSLFDPEQVKQAQNNISAINERTANEVKRARGLEDIIKENKIGQLERGQSYELGKLNQDSSRILSDLAIAKGANLDIYNQMLNAGKTAYDMQTEQDKYTRALAQENLQASAPALLAQLGTLPDQAAKDAYIRNKAQELGVSIDMLNSSLQAQIPKETATKFETVTLGSGKTARKVRYGYDAAGNIVSAIDLATGQDYAGQSGGITTPISTPSPVSNPSSSKLGSASVDADVKRIIARNPGEWGNAADEIDRKYGAGAATFYDGLLKKAYAPKPTSKSGKQSLADMINAAF